MLLRLTKREKQLACIGKTDRQTLYEGAATSSFTGLLVVMWLRLLQQTNGPCVLGYYVTLFVMSISSSLLGLPIGIAC
jgi:hypothetical protein